MSTIRTFIAIEIPKAVQERIAEVQSDLKSFGERISWTKPQNIHLTMKFLGNVHENKIDAIGETLRHLGNQVRPFKFQINNLGAFPNLKRARVLWVGIDEPEGHSVALAQKIDDALIHLGFSKEKRRFKPHLTIGRVKSPLSKGFIEKFNDLKFHGGSVDVHEMILMKSMLKSTGAVHTPLYEIKFEPHNGGKRL